LGIFNQRLTKKELVNLFLVIAFPIHAWSILLVLNDAKWVAERTNSWDVIGYGSYALVVAFFESVFIFLIALMLSFFLPRKWDGNKVVVVLGSLSLVVAAWTILEQAFYFIPEAKIDYFYAFVYYRLNFTLAYVLAALFIGAVIASVLLPVFLIATSEKVTHAVMVFFERLNLLSTLYISLDVLGFLIIVYRNIIYQA
jgi:hypothetical protein